MSRAQPTRHTVAAPQISLVAQAVRTHIHGNHRHLLATAALGGIMAMPVSAGAQDAAIEEIIVTSARREQSMQEVPIAVTALDNTALTQQGITNFEDYAVTLSNVAFKTFGKPANATIFMRGAADGGDGNASGSAPSVGLYLDEQPVTAIAANLDVHIYDIARIEALAGPQGTLFGASAQAGALRIITNKPDPTAFDAGIDVGGFGTKDGDPSYSLEGYANIPMGDRTALRLVGWYVDEGGWIDNVPGGVRNYDLTAGRTDQKTNDAFVKENINEKEKAGARAALGIDLSDNWTLTASLLYQNMDTKGVWEHNSRDLPDFQVQRFNDESSSDEFSQFALTLEGEFANHSLVYAGSVMDRDTQYQTDYSAYGDYLTWVPYYACDYSATPTDDATDCTSLDEYYTADNKYERSSHELRLLSMGDGRFHYTVGAFLQQNKHKYLQQWHQPEMAPSLMVGGPTTGIYFRTDQERELDQVALFGELTFDFTDNFSGTFGARWFDEESSLRGVVGWGPGNFAPAPDGRDTFTDTKVSNSDTIYKANLAWTLSDDFMIYGTWSEGYRPGGINRDPNLIITAGTQNWVPDFLTNYEVGMKSTFADGRVRLNAAIYTMDWDKIQYTVYDFSLSACCGNVYNLSTAKVQGFEADMTWVPSDNWTINASLTLNDGETTADFVLPSGALSVPSGTRLPNVPDVKGALLVRYDWPVRDFNYYVQAAFSYTGSSTSEITPPVPDRRFPGDNGTYPQSAYTIANARAGLSKGNWGVDLFVNNFTNEVAEFYVHPRNYEYTVVTNRPMSAGAKLWMRFQ